MIIQASNIHKSYFDLANKLEVLKGIDLEIGLGEVVAIVGPSGAGKSTLLHILGGLDQPTEGAVVLDGNDVYWLNDKSRAKLRNEKIGFVFQFYHLLQEFNALENVLLPAMIKNAKEKENNQERALNLLDTVGLSGRVKHKPYELSGGEQQRVAIARALINEPQIILCDEPTGNLDSQSGQDVIKVLMQLNQKNKQTLLIITHDEEIARLCHRTIQMKDGQLI